MYNDTKETCECFADFYFLSVSIFSYVDVSKPRTEVIILILKTTRKSTPQIDNTRIDGLELFWLSGYVFSIFEIGVFFKNLKHFKRVPILKKGFQNATNQIIGQCTHKVILVKF